MVKRVKKNQKFQNRIIYEMLKLAKKKVGLISKTNLFQNNL